MFAGREGVLLVAFTPSLTVGLLPRFGPGLHDDFLVAHTGLEPVISALRGQRVNQLHQCAAKRDLIIKAPHESTQTRALRSTDTFQRLERSFPRSE